MAERISIRELSRYAGLLGRGSLARMAYNHANALMERGAKPKIYLTNAGFTVEAKGEATARFG